MKSDIRIAAIVCRCIAGDPRHNLHQTAQWVKAAADSDAAVVAFPEMNITGYLPRPEVSLFAESIPGPSTDVLLELARDHDVAILAGLAEKDGQGRIFASHVVAEPGGGLHVYRKLHAAPPEKGIFTPGNETPVFQTRGMTFGIQLCYDAHFPELSAIMALRDADVIFMPHASPRGTVEGKCDSWMRHLPARAFDNSLFVIAWNQNGNNGKGLTFPGVALAMDPSGRPIHKQTALDDSDFMTLIDLEASAIDSVRNHRMRYFLPNRRPDIYTAAHASIKTD